ncbi:MAG: RNA methyltransferase [Actinomycetaceae bacterium]|nr:RNA methyltransferase [Actinomycetaceae bacterium]
MNETQPILKSEPGRGVGPWPGGRDAWPEGEQWDPELLENGDARNVEDRFRYWKMSAIVAELDQRSNWLEVAIENLGHDFNIGSIVRTANAMGVRHVHIVGRRRWNRRGAMVTDRYLTVTHHPEVEDFIAHMRARDLRIIGVDNVDGSVPLEDEELPRQCVLVMGEESAGLSEKMAEACDRVVHITQYGSTRSMNVGHAAAIAMWAWVVQYRENGLVTSPAD